MIFIIILTLTAVAVILWSRFLDWQIYKNSTEKSNADPISFWKFLW